MLTEKQVRLIELLSLSKRYIHEYQSQIEIYEQKIEEVYLTVCEALNIDPHKSL